MVTRRRHSPQVHSRPAVAGCTSGRAHASGLASTLSPSLESREPSSSPGDDDDDDNDGADDDGDDGDVNVDGVGNLALEAMRMEIFIQGVDPGSLKWQCCQKSNVILIVEKQCHCDDQYHRKSNVIEILFGPSKENYISVIKSNQSNTDQQESNVIR